MVVDINNVEKVLKSEFAPFVKPNPHLNHGTDTDARMNKGQIKIVFDDGFKTNLIFASEVWVNDTYVIMRDAGDEKMQIIAWRHIIRMMYKDASKVHFE